MYKLCFEKRAAKEFQRLPKTIKEKIKNKLLILQEDPNKLKNNIKLLNSDSKLKRLRVGDYRIIFKEEKKALIILIIRIAHRKESYD